MKTQEIISMAHALKAVREGKKLDPVDKKDAMGDYEDRDDKDIDNDGDTDSSDRYLHNRRKKVTKKVAKESMNPLKRYKQMVSEGVNKDGQMTAEVPSDQPAQKLGEPKTIAQQKREHIRRLREARNQMPKNGQMPRDHVDGKQPAESEHDAKPVDQEKMKKVNKEAIRDGATMREFLDAMREAAGQMAREKVPQQPAEVQGSPKNIKQGKETSATKATNKLDQKQAPAELDGVKAIAQNHKSEKEANRDAETKQKSVAEDYQTNQDRYVGEMADLADQISEMVEEMVEQHEEAREASKRITDAYRQGKEPSDEDSKKAGGLLYNAKELVRSLMECRDALEVSQRAPIEESKQTPAVRYAKPSNPESRTPLSIRDAMLMMHERADRAKHYEGATDPQEYDDNWSGKAKEFANKHKVEEPDYADINKVAEMNKTEVGASLARKVNHRHNDQTIGDKTRPGADKYRGRRT